MPAPFDFDDDAVEQALAEQLRAFRAKFGRDPGPETRLQEFYLAVRRYERLHLSCRAQGECQWMRKQNVSELVVVMQPTKRGRRPKWR